MVNNQYLKETFEKIYEGNFERLIRYAFSITKDKEIAEDVVADVFANLWDKRDQLNNIKEEFPKLIKEIRGRGFLIGLQLYKDQTNFIKDLMNSRLLTIRAAENVVRILPPLNVKKSEIDLALKIIHKVCLKFK